MKKIFTILMLLTGLTAAVRAQQFSPRTQFYENRLSYNPAVAGSELEIPLKINFRQQWVGMDDAPTTQTLLAHGFSGKNVGLGLVIYNDVAGPSRNTGFQTGVARHFALDSEGKRWFSFGMSLMLYQFRFDVDRLKTDLPNDPAVLALAKQNSRLTPDAAVGIYINDDNGYAGLSCTNLLQTKADLFDKENNPNTIHRAYYLLGGYRFPVNKDFSIEPMVQVKVTEAAAWQGSVMVRANYQQYWAGLAYRTGDAASALFGLRKDLFSFSYSYDYPVSEIGSFNNGTHELTAGVFIFNPLSRYGPQQKREDRSGQYNRRRRR